MKVYRIPTRLWVWAIVPVAVALSFYLKPVPQEWGLYSLYTTLSSLPVPVPQAVFQPQPQPSEEPTPEVTIVAKKAEGGPILNQTDYTPDLTQTSRPQKTEEGPQVLVLHTHTCESYTPSEAYAYTPSDTDRTEDPRFNMIAIGQEVTRVLNDAGISTLHDTTVCDLPSYAGSYQKSLSVAQEALKKHPTIRVILDLHRDAVELDDGSKVKFTTQIEGKTVAQAMAVIGTDASGQKHDRWRENFAFANALQKTADQNYPNLMRPMNLRTGRFNQQLSPGALLYEIGTTGNTQEEARLCARYFAKTLIETLKGT